MTVDSNYWRKKGALLRSKWTSSKTKNGRRKKAKKGGSINSENEELQEIDFNELKIGKVIGMGAFAEVYCALWNQTQVAVKKLKITDKQDVAHELIAEAEILYRLIHPNIIRFIGVCTQPNNLCLITEYAERGDLFSLLHTTKVNNNAHSPSTSPMSTLKPDIQSFIKDAKTIRESFHLRVKILLDAAKGVGFLHSQNPVIIHRDLKSHNLLLNSNWDAKVCDFGISRVKEMTATMTQVGTPQWMAKEILLGQKYSEKADVYSFGVIMWETLYIKKPYEGIHPLRVISMVAHEGYKLPVPIERLPEPLKLLMKKCFSNQPQKRPDFHEIVATLEQFTNSSEENGDTLV